MMDALIKSYASPASYFLQPADCDNVVQDIASLSMSPANSLYSAFKSTVKNYCKTDETNWIRRLGYVERLATRASYHGNLTTVYALWLDSKSPVSFQSIKKTSYIVYRKMPHLRMCIGRHRGDRWWKEMDTVTLDIEEMQSSDVEAIYENLLQHRYNIYEGPLWCVRFIKTPLQEFDPMNSTSNYKYVCIFGFHHNISDGTTNMNFCNVFLKVLNNVLLKKPISLKEEGRFAAPLHDQMSDKSKSYLYICKILLLRVYKSILMYCRCLNNYLKYYPFPITREIGTKVICKEFDDINTLRLLKRCRMEGVSLNSAFTAAANLALYAMILEKNYNLRITHFDCQQAVNMRRYWPKNIRENSYGCHISMLDFQIPTFYEDMDNFWEYSRRIHDMLSNDLCVTKRAIKLNPLSEKLGLAICINSYLAKLGIGSILDSHYCITNMGNVNSLFSGEGEEVEVSRILRSVTCHFMQALCQHTLQTFRGKFYYSLDYYPHRMPVEIARTYASNLMSTLRKAIHTPN